MKSFFLSVCLLLAQYFAGVDFYDISIESLDGTQTKMSAYQGKKIIITVVSANAEGLKMVKLLDSVQAANDSIRAIAIPTGDFNGSVNPQDLKDLKKSISIVVTKPLKVKRSNGTQQHPLFAWLTQSSENSHFNMDVGGEGQLFIVSPKGTLYCVLPKNTPQKFINKAINQTFTE